MDLEEIATSGWVQRIGKTIKKNAFIYSMATLMTISPIMGCGGDGGGSSSHSKKHKPTVTQPVNHSPVFNSVLSTEATENQLYSYVVNITDSDGDAFTIDPVTLPAGTVSTQLDDNNIQLDWTPTDTQSNQYNQILLEADDGISAPSQLDVNVWAYNVESVSGNIQSFYFDNLQNIQVTLTGTNNYSATTDVNGNWAITGILDGTYSTMLKDINVAPLYETHKAGNLIVNKTKNMEGKLVVDMDLYRIADRGFVNEVQRNLSQTPSGIITKWIQKPVFDIYTKEVRDNVDVSAVNVIGVKDTIKNEVSNFYQQVLTDSNINEISELPIPGQPANGHIKVYWNNNYATGGNGEWFNNNEIIGGFARFNTSLGKSTWMQEIIEVLIGKGESNYYVSVFNDPATISTLSLEDEMISEAHYGIYARPAGNQDLVWLGIPTATEDDHDVNSSGYTINP